MEHLPKKIHHYGISYTLVGDYYIPDLKLPEEVVPMRKKVKSAPLSRKSGAMPPLRNWTSPY